MHILSRGNSKCKGPGASTYLVIPGTAKTEEPTRPVLESGEVHSSLPKVKDKGQKWNRIELELLLFN